MGSLRAGLSTNLLNARLRNVFWSAKLLKFALPDDGLKACFIISFKDDSFASSALIAAWFSARLILLLIVVNSVDIRS